VARRERRELGCHRRQRANLLGYVALRSVDLEFGFAEITYWVLPPFRGRGVATKACAVVAGWALEDLGLHRLEVRHSVENPASCRVASNAGFELEATLRSALLHADGWHDMHLHSRIAETGLKGGTAHPSL
jgi:ribosomal-protein-alanine N-acetyltransferase